LNRRREFPVAFEILFIPCKRAEEEVQRTNPFTGEAVADRPYVPLSAGELAAVQALLDEVKAKRLEAGGYSFAFADGGSAQILGEDFREGCLVSLWGLTPDVLRFLLDLGRAGNMQMRPIMEEELTVVPSPELLEGEQGDWRNPVFCESAAELGELIAGGFRAWQRYRDQVARPRPTE
jgi:hypothetical protein